MNIRNGREDGIPPVFYISIFWENKDDKYRLKTISQEEQNEDFYQCRY